MITKELTEQEKEVLGLFLYNLKHIMKKKDIATFGELMEQAGLDESSPSKWTAGRSLPTMRSVVKISDALGVGIWELFQGGSK